MQTNFWSEIGDLHYYHVLMDPAAMQRGLLIGIADLDPLHALMSLQMKQNLMLMVSRFKRINWR